MSRSDHEDIAKIVGNQRHTPQDERPHEDLAQLGVGLHELQQLIPTELDQLAALGDTDAGETPEPKEHIDLAAELPGKAGGKPGDKSGDATVDDDEEVDGLDARFHDHVASLDGPAMAMRGNARDLRRCQYRKG